MAKKHNKQRHVKARQAAQARTARNITQLGAYSHSNLAKTADQQLVNIAKTLGAEWERQKQQTVAQAKNTPYHALTAERPTRKDLMFAGRAPITDAQINAEPISKRRKLLRQQQRRINDAQRKINAWNKAQASPRKSVYEQRVDEIRGVTGESFGRNQIIPSKLTDFLQMENVLADEAFVRAQLKGGHRNELLDQMHDAAEILGLRTEQTKPQSSRKKRKPHGRTGLPYGEEHAFPSYMSRGRYEVFEKILGATLGSKRLRQFRRLSDARKRAFIEQTDAPRAVFQWDDYDPVSHRFRPVFRDDGEGYRRSRRQFDRWLAESAVLA